MGEDIAPGTGVEVGTGRLVEWRIFGPPGTGKTTELSRRIKSTCEKFGSSSVMVCSLTKTAAKELAGRDLPISKDRVGTLHSFAFRALGNPTIAETEGNFKAFNLMAKKSPSFPDKSSATLDDPYSNQVDTTVYAKSANLLLQEYNSHRLRMNPLKIMRGSVRQFAEEWEAFKEENDLLDFTDLIKIAYERRPYPPVEAQVLYADEVQDFSPLELALLRSWAKNMRHLIIAADDDQCIYGYRGSIPDAVLDPPIPDERIIVLSTSYRLPRKIKETSDVWIRQVARRQPKNWNALDSNVGGNLSSANYTWKNVSRFGHDIENGIRQNPDETHMVVASCGYMLRPIIRQLKSRGLPHWNPYRPDNREWNTMFQKKREAVLEFLCADVSLHGKNARSPDWRSFWSWLQHIDVKKLPLKKGAKKICKQRANDPLLGSIPLKYEDYTLLGMAPPPFLDWEWFFKRILDSTIKGFAFLHLICCNFGPKALLETPRITVGTIHSVKGGEADNVYVIPDLSQRGYSEYCSTGKDSITRLFYVAFTRTKKQLILCQSATPRCVDFLLFKEVFHSLVGKETNVV